VITEEERRLSLDACMEDVEGENDADSYASEESSHFPGDLKYQIPDKLTNFILSLKESQATQIASSLDSAAIEIPEEHNAQTGDEARPQALIKHLTMTNNLRR